MAERSQPHNVEAIANLDELGAFINAIHALSRAASDIEAEDARAINTLAALATVEWRKLDMARELRVVR